MAIPTFGDPRSDNPAPVLCDHCDPDQIGGPHAAVDDCEGCGDSVCHTHGEVTRHRWLCWDCIERLDDQLDDHEETRPGTSVCTFCGTVHLPLRVGEWEG